MGLPYHLDLSSTFLDQTGGTPSAFLLMVKKTGARPTIPTKIANPPLAAGGDAEIFEIDRSNLVLQLRTIRRAINETAEEMEMVAIERVFVKPVSQALTRTAQKLYRVSEDLNGVHRVIERARFPKALERSAPKTKLRNRRKTPK